jgi:subtilisin family serine protease
MSLSPKMMEQLIFGTERQRRFTQDSPVLPDVWLEYNEKPNEPVDLLLTPYRDGQPAELFKQLRERLLQGDSSRRNLQRREITYNESYVVARLTFEEMIRRALPLTKWWVDYVWPPPRRPAEGRPPRAERIERLRQRIRRLRSEECLDELTERLRRRRALGDEDFEALPATPADIQPSSDLLWMIEIVGALALEAESPKAEGKTEKLPDPEAVVKTFQKLLAGLEEDQPPQDPLLWAINRNRSVTQAVWKSSLAVKADAARRLFEISCKGLRWAVIDSGIDAKHPAFKNRDARGKPIPGAGQTRIVETYDFTRLRSILNPEDPATILKKGGVIRFNAEDRKRRKGLREIRRRVEEGRMLDWDRLADLIRVPLDKDYHVPRNPHGTHVAGILAGDWRRDDGEDGKEGVPDDYDLFGMCPDLELIDLRVLDDKGNSDEFTILAALQFVRYLNANQMKPAVNGVNLSLSLLHNVMNYACGRTPVCDECHRLVNTGTVVVAAAGNEGYASFVTSAGSKEGYRNISITDPGNAEGVITVGATHRNRAFTYGVSYFSSRGPTGDGRIKPDLVAPGEKITGPVPGGDLDTFDGTSMAAPHVSGAAAMLMARHDELIGDPARIKRILCDTATDLGRERFFQGHGMLDVLRALQSV